MIFRALQCFFLILISFLLYANTLSNAFIWDDRPYILNNSWMKDPQYLPLYFTADFCEGASQDCGFFRPMVSLSYLLDFILWGTDPFGFHLTNIVFHTLAVLLVFAVGIQLFEGMRPKPFFPVWVPFISALVFALHPVHVESVAVIANRTDPPTAVWMLATFYCFLTARRIASPVRWAWYGTSLFCFSIALLTKEMAVMLPGVLVVYGFLFRRRQEEGMPGGVKGYIPYFVLVLVYFLVRWGALGYAFSPATDPSSLPDRLVHLPALLMGYLKILVFPFPLRVFHPAPSIAAHPIQDGLLPVLLSGVLLYVLFRLRNDQPVTVFALGWVLISLLPVLNLTPIVYPAVTERFSYIPSIGFSYFIGHAIGGLLARLSAKRLKVPLIVTSVIFLLIGGGWAGMIVQRNGDWKDELHLWAAEIERTPPHYLAHYNYGVFLSAAGRTEEAAEQYRKAVALDPEDAHPYVNLGRIEESRGNWGASQKWYEKAVSADRGSFGAHFYYGNLLLKKKEWGRARVEFQKALQIDPTSPRVHYILGTLFLQEGRLSQAREAFESAVRYNPRFSDAHINLGIVLQSMGEPEAAFQSFQTAAEVEPRNANAHRNLGMALLMEGEYEEAERIFLKTLEMRPNWVDIHRMLGFLYLDHLEQWEKAYEHFIKVREFSEQTDPKVEAALERIRARPGHSIQ